MQRKLAVERSLREVRALVKDVADFPKPGVSFKDVSPLLANPKAMSALIEAMAESLLQNADVAACVESTTGRPALLAGLESRGFLFQSLAARLGLGFVMLRNKPGKTPNPISLDAGYATEYSSDNVLELSSGVVSPGQPVILIDDVLATGGSLLAGCALIRKAGGLPVAAICPIELSDLGGRRRIASLEPRVSIHSILPYPWIDAGELPAPVFHVPNPCKPVDVDAHARDNRIVLFYPPSMAGLGDYLLEMFPSTYRKGLVDWARFPDGTPNLTFEDPKYLAHRDVVFLADSRLDESIALQQSLLLVLPRQMIASLQIVLSFFGFGTMERVNREGVLASAETFLKMLSGVEHTFAKKPILRLLDIHALPERFYVNSESVIVQMDSALDLLMDRVTFFPADDPFLASLNDDSTQRTLDNKVPITAIVFTDDGAKKRFADHPIFATATWITCSKIRCGDERKIAISEIVRPSARMWQHVLLVDDLVMTGGTLLECRHAIQAEAKKLGVAVPPKVSCYVTHGVFPKDAWKRFAAEKKNGGGFENFWCTDSNPHVALKLAGVAPFEVLSVAFLYGPLLAKAIYKEDFGRTVSLASQELTKRPSCLIRAASLPLERAFEKTAVQPAFTVVLVASTNKDKLDAAYTSVVARLSTAHNITPALLARLAVVGFPIQPTFQGHSTCPPQPLGRSQTERGCRDRLNLLMETARKSSAFFASPPTGVSVVYLAIESGVVSVLPEDEKLLRTQRFDWSMWHSPSGFADVAVVAAAVRGLDGRTRLLNTVHHGAHTRVSPSAVQESIASGQQQTVGQIYERLYGWPRQSWHFAAAGHTRSERMAPALDAAFCSALCEKDDGSTQIP